MEKKPGENLSTLMKCLGASQEIFGVFLDVSHRTIGNWKVTGPVMKDKHYDRLKEVGINPSFIFGDGIMSLDPNEPWEAVCDRFYKKLDDLQSQKIEGSE